MRWGGKEEQRASPSLLIAAVEAVETEDVSRVRGGKKERTEGKNRKRGKDEWEEDQEVIR